ncbi:outer membrane beta-barrel family protein [Mucilaginibacter sp. dw_454]|uniref:outer membrane beta-barrel family protein n=1 Tax=Mucilaginibacter sp. dw_454 TaxID=2720079 RepID=UPI001BD20201|nr:outer membrane beta-barrel family protein [Mucilaginibacter sp. dw_454]
MKRICLLFILIVSFIRVNAQANGRVSGKIIDADTKQPIEYVSISIFKIGVASPFNGSVSHTKGNFVISNIPNGEYSIRIDFMGYKSATIDHIALSNSVRAISLNTISFVPAQTQLQNVTIVGKAPMVENKIDKLVYNAANDLTSQGGAALDVLKKVPQVTVDIDGNVELQGNANIRFLINGKPSSIFGASLTDALQSIPASQIKSIEVVTSPGAKYDANGTGGIINIILKDSKVQGINGAVNLSAGTRLNTASVNLGVRKGNIGVNAFFSGNDQFNTTTITTNDRYTTDNTLNNTTHLYQKGSGNFARSGYQSGLSFNWNISKKDELTASVGFNHFGNHTNGITNQDQMVNESPSENSISDLLSLRNSNSRFNANAIDYSLAYKKTFKKEGQELDVLYNSSQSKNNSYSFQQQDYQTGNFPSSGTMNTNPGKDRETDIAIDYVQPISKNFSLETGVKGVFENINNNVVTDTLAAGGFVPNADQTYGFNYKRNVYAYYLSAQFSLFGFFDAKAGLRDEYTNTRSDFPNAHIPGYNILAPSAILSHKIDPTQSIKVSYSYRIERPDYNDLNPFYNISDPHNISTGNPNLRPEIGHNYELGYNKSYNSGANFYAGVFYRYNTNDIQSYTTQFDTLNVGGTKYTNVFLNQRYNVGTETTEGLSLFGSVPVGNKLNLRANTMFADRITTNPGNPKVSGFTYRLNLNTTYQFDQNLVAEVFGNYNSSQRTIQGTRPAFFSYNLAIRKLFFNKNASIGFTTADPFTKYVDQRSLTSGTNFTQSSLRQVPFRTFGLSLSYKFGKLEFKKEKENDDNNGGLQAPPEN